MSNISKYKNGWLLWLFILIGIVLGGLIAELTASVHALSWLSYGQSFGLDNPLVLNLGNGLPIETVSKMLGHRFISTTEIYARVTKSKIAKEMQPLMGSEHTRVLRKALRLCPSRTPKKSSPIIGM